MNYDDFGEVVNGTDTYETIARNLKLGISTIIGWTDGEASHFDILFTKGAEPHGTLQGGVEGSDLFISIMRCGSFGFEVGPTDTHHGYYAEKLRMYPGKTTEALAELINGVKVAMK